MEITRFRGYQLGSKGSSFSYCDGNKFTLIEARLTEQQEKSLKEELIYFDKDNIDILHITSWDQDHCNFDDLKIILEKYSPYKVQYPGYSPHTDNGKSCLKLIKQYENNESSDITISKIDNDYISKLDTAKSWETDNVIYNTRKVYENPNDNSVIKLFRSGHFNVASFGDIESTEIRDMIMRSKIFSKEIDVLILAHHGADNGFTTNELIKKLSPSIAICTSNYDNQYDHPSENIRKMLYDNKVTLYTTKTGDVIIEGKKQKENIVYNFISNSETLSSKKSFISKKFD
jgi:competence protein ComEC